MGEIDKTRTIWKSRFVEIDKTQTHKIRDLSKSTKLNNERIDIFDEIDKSEKHEIRYLLKQTKLKHLNSDVWRKCKMSSLWVLRLVEHAKPKTEFRDLSIWVDNTSLFYLFVHPFIHSITFSCIQSFIHWFICPTITSFISSSVHSFNHSCIDSFIHPFITLFTYFFFSFIDASFHGERYARDKLTSIQVNDNCFNEHCFSCRSKLF